MLWPFRKKPARGATTTTEHDESGFSDPSLTADAEPSAEGGRLASTDSGGAAEAPVSASARPSDSGLRSGAFSFGFTRGQAEGVERSAAGPTERARADEMTSGSGPLGGGDGVAEVVRRKVRSGARGVPVDLAARGLAPVSVPSLRETAVLYRMAAAAAMARDPERAAGLWGGYLELCPADAKAWCGLGQACLALRRHDAAWSAFLEAYQRDGGDALTCAALGWLRGRQGEHAESARFYSAAVAADPENLDYLVSLAEAQTRSGDGLGAARSQERIARITAEVVD